MFKNLCSPSSLALVRFSVYVSITPISALQALSRCFNIPIYHITLFSLLDHPSHYSSFSLLFSPSSFTMAKRNQRCSVNQAAIIAKNLAHPSHWAVTKLLGSSEHFFSSMSAASLTDAKRLFRADIVAVVPESPVEADWVREGWTCFYYYPFDLGLTFPFSRLVNDLLSSLNIAHGQLMPSTWRMLACLDAVEDKHRLGINVDVLKFAYTTKKYGCRVGLINKMRGEPLILNNESVHDRGWNKDFFFAEIVTLESSDSFLLDHWTDESIIPVFLFHFTYSLVPCSIPFALLLNLV